MAKCPLLLMHSYHWEEINASYLIDAGLATKYDASRPLVKQIESYVLSHRGNVKKDNEIENWREKLDFYIDALIKNK